MVSPLSARFGAQELCEGGGGRPGFPVPNSPYGLCGRKGTLEKEQNVWPLNDCVRL